MPVDKADLFVLVRQSMWLKHQRLHKYTDLLVYFSASQLKAAEMEELLAAGMVSGAAKKLLQLDIPDCWPEKPMAHSVQSIV